MILCTITRIWMEQRKTAINWYLVFRLIFLIFPIYNTHIWTKYYQTMCVRVSGKYFDHYTHYMYLQTPHKMLRPVPDMFLWSQPASNKTHSSKPNHSKLPKSKNETQRIWTYIPRLCTSVKQCMVCNSKNIMKLHDELPSRIMTVYKATGGATVYFNGRNIWQRHVHTLSDSILFKYVCCISEILKILVKKQSIKL